MHPVYIKTLTGVKNRSLGNEPANTKQAMLRLFTLAYAITILLMISKALNESNKNIVRTLDNSFHKESPSLFLFHLLKLKKKINKIEQVPTTPPTADCICVPYYLCDANRTIIGDSIGTIDIR